MIICTRYNSKHLFIQQIQQTFVSHHTLRTFPLWFSYNLDHFRFILYGWDVVYGEVYWQASAHPWCGALHSHLNPAGVCEGRCYASLYLACCPWCSWSAELHTRFKRKSKESTSINVPQRSSDQIASQFPNSLRPEKSNDKLFLKKLSVFLK